MLLPFSIRVADSPVWERAVYSVSCTCLSWALVKFCVCPSVPFGIEDWMWGVIALIPEHCLSIYFKWLSLMMSLLVTNLVFVCVFFFTKGVLVGIWD